MIKRNYEEPVETSARPIENANFLDVDHAIEESEDQVDILLVDDEGEPETENSYVLDV